jgi:hypothetical protein
MRAFRAFALSGALLWLFAQESSRAQLQKGKPVQKGAARKTMNHDAAVELITIPDGQYRTIGEARLRTMSGQLAPGDEDLEKGAVSPILAIGGPKVLDLQTMRNLSVLVATRVDGKRAWAVDRDQNLTWFVTDLSTGVLKIQADRALDKLRMMTPEPSGSGKPPSDFDSKVVRYAVERMQVPDMFGDRWPQGRYAVTLIYFDWASNTYVFATKPQPKEKPELRLAPTPNVQAMPGPVLEATGNVMSTGKPGSADSTLVRVVVSMSADDAPLAKSTDPAVSHPLLPLTIVLQKLDSGLPDALNLAVPVVVENGRIMTRFALNLKDHVQLSALHGEYQVYLSAGAIVTGPRVLAAPV